MGRGGIWWLALSAPTLWMVPFSFNLLSKYSTPLRVCKSGFAYHLFGCSFSVGFNEEEDFCKEAKNERITGMASLAEISRADGNDCFIARAVSTWWRFKNFADKLANPENNQDLLLK